MQMPVFLTLFFAPVYVPLQLLRGWIHGVARANPVTYLLETGRGFLAGDAPHVALAFALAAVGLAMGVVWGPRLAAAFAGWLLAGPLAIGVLAEFSRVDTRRRTHAVYSAPRWVPNVYWAILGVCLLGIAVGAWHIALWAGTL